MWPRPWPSSTAPERGRALADSARTSRRNGSIRSSPTLVLPATTSSCRRRSVRPASTRRWRDHPAGDEAWVFAYGSLMWNPAFEYRRGPARQDRRLAPLLLLLDADGPGHAGLPGLMLALENGGECEGIAYRLSPELVRSELGILWNREMLAGLYQARWVPAKLNDGRTVKAVTFVVDPRHCQYCGDLPIERAAHHIAFAEGRRGACRDYLTNTAEHARVAGHQRSLPRGDGGPRRPAARAAGASSRPRPDPRR